MGKSWRDYLEREKADRAIKVDEALQAAKDSKEVMWFRQEWEHFVAYSDGINMILNSYRRLDDGTMQVDIFTFSEKYGVCEKIQTIISKDEKSDFFLHRHDFYEIAYVMQGELEQILRDRTIIVKENEFFIMNPNIEHFERVSWDALLLNIQVPMKMIDILLREGRFSDKLKVFFGCSPDENKEKQEYIHYAPLRKRAANDFVIEQLLDEQSNGHVGSGLIIRGLLARLLFMLDSGREYEYQLYSTNLTESIRIFKSMERYLTEKKWNVEKGELAKVFHYNESYLSRIVKKITGMTLIKYCVEHKLNYAEQLLCYSELSVNEIVVLLGYQNKTYFYRIFKQKYGITPKEFRQNIKKGY